MLLIAEGNFEYRIELIDGDHETVDYSLRDTISECIAEILDSDYKVEVKEVSIHNYYPETKVVI